MMPSIAVFLLAATLLCIGRVQAQGGWVTSAAGGAATAAVSAVASVTGDPIITDFTERTFEFQGGVGKTYSVISGDHHTVSMRLKEGHMFDHEGTYIEAMGFSYRNHNLTIELAPYEVDALQVVLDGEELQMQKGQTQLEHVVAIEGSGELMLLWDSHREGLGQAVEITTDLLQLLIFVTPAGTVDEGGVVQPAYLNFDATLLKTPNDDLQGVVGESYARLISGVTLPKDGKFHGNEAAYEVEDFFVPLAASARNNILRASGGYTVAQRRRLIEAMPLSFPFRSQARSTAASA